MNFIALYYRLYSAYTSSMQTFNNVTYCNVVVGRYEDILSASYCTVFVSNCNFSHEDMFI